MSHIDYHVELALVTCIHSLYSPLFTAMFEHNHTPCKHVPTILQATVHLFCCIDLISIILCYHLSPISLSIPIFPHYSYCTKNYS